MKKLKSIPVYFLMIINLSLFLNSCSNDNPVNSPPPDQPYDYDSARFDWTVDTLGGSGFLYGFLGSLWAVDTNEILIPNIFENSLLHLKDGVKTITYYPAENRVGLILDDDQNNGYRIGDVLIGNFYQPIIQKWDGSAFVDISNPQNFDRNFFIWTAMIKNDNEMWFGLTDGTVVKYDGKNFTSYPSLGPDIVFTKIFYDNLNQLTILAWDPHHKIDHTEFFVFQLINDTWVKVFADYDMLRPIRYNTIENSIIASSSNGFYKLVDSTLVPTLTVPNIYYLTFDATSNSNILITGYHRIENYISPFFHWNGKKWSREGPNNFPMVESRVHFLNENVVYIVTYDHTWNLTYLMRGTKKTY
ncbi:MAG: hypothetical protein KDD00_11525 [Ignavibacteriae bacterium]|nr:hypothetical protein [Ignavibacteriota bacterium]